MRESGRVLAKSGRVLAKSGRVLAIVAVTALALAGLQALRPLPSQAVTIRYHRQTVSGPVFKWPAARESAVAVSGLGAILTAGAQTPVPIASTAKIMTAYVVLRDHPLGGQDPGPSILMTRADKAAYRSGLAASDSVVKVAAGETLTETQALEALLIPSADNMADILARWDAGSIRAFAARMNATARSLGMAHTHYTDPSGLAPATVSTARDQLILTRVAMTIPAFARIVAMPAARLPVAGTVQNFDYAVGHNGIIGVKTGSDPAALGCWVFAAARVISGSWHTVYGVVLGVPATAQGMVEPALAAGEAIANAVPGSVRPRTVLPAGTVIGQVAAGWRGTPVPVITTRPITGLVSSGSLIRFRAKLRSLAGVSVRHGEELGVLTVSGVPGAGSAPLVAAASGHGPTLAWRLARL